MKNKKTLILSMLIGAPLWAESFDDLEAEARAMGKIACSMAESDVLFVSEDNTTGVMASCKDGYIHAYVRREPNGEILVLATGQDTPLIRVLPDGKVVANRSNGADGGMLSTRLLVDGSVQVLPIVDDANHGASISRLSNSVILILQHVDGMKNGASVAHVPDGTVAVIPYVDGKPHGKVVYRQPDGEVSMHDVVMGEPVGEAITHPALKSALGQ